MRPGLRELAHRASIDVDVTLAWAPDSNTVVVLCHESDGRSLEFAVRGEDAMLAFHHPFAYAALATSTASLRRVAAQVAVGNGGWHG